MPAVIPSLQQVSAGAVHEKRKPVRRDPERRRQQNAEAQKKYREKLRQRLDALEALAAIAAENQAAAATVAAQAATTAAPRAAPPRLASDVAQSPILRPQRASPPSNASIVVVKPNVQSPRSPWTAHPVSPFTHFRWGAPAYTPPSESTTSDSSPETWDSDTCINPSYLIRSSQQKPDYFQRCTVTMDCGCATPHSHVLSRNPEAAQRGEFRIINFGGHRLAHGGADPYANHLRLEVICTVAAVSTLVTYLGITEEVLCAEDSLSPFFRPGAATADAAVRTVQRIFKTLKPDLRPSRAQITVEHHPYIDILPFPTLRNSLIAHRATIDEDEFFEDSLGGLVCWGGAGLGQRDREAATGRVSTGAPWDVRSWEAKPWFVRKYWDFLGGEDGELVRQSDWWREMRGEDALDTVCV